MVSCSRNAQVSFVEKPIINKLLNKIINISISNSYLVRKSFKGYRCESSIAIITNYAYNPFIVLTPATCLTPGCVKAASTVIEMIDKEVVGALHFINSLFYQF